MFYMLLLMYHLHISSTVTIHVHVGNDEKNVTSLAVFSSHITYFRPPERLRTQCGVLHPPLPVVDGAALQGRVHSTYGV